MPEAEISLPLLNMLLSLGDAVGVAVGPVDRQGLPHSPFPMLPDFCSLVMGTPVGRGRCEDCFRSAVGDLAAAGRTSVLHTCHAGVSFVVARVAGTGEDERYVVAGRCLLEPMELARLDPLAGEWGVEVQALRASAASLPVVSAYRLTALQAHLDALAQWNDALRRCRAEATSRRMDLAALAQAGEYLASAPPLELFLRTLLDLATESLDATGGAIMLVDEASGSLVTSVAKGLAPDPAPLHAMPEHAGQVISAPAARGRVIAAAGSSAHKRASGGPGEATPPLCTFWVSMESSGEALGVLGVNCRQPASVQESMLRFTLLQLLATQGAVAVKFNVLQRELLEKERLANRLLDATIGAQEQERERICLEIHDGVAQTLVAALRRLEAAAAQLDSDPKEAAQLVAGSARLLRDSLREVREIIGSLRPATLDTLGLVATLRAELRRLETELGWQTELRAVSLKLSKEMETAVYRILQEALTNARNHSETKRVSVRLTVRRRWLVGEVRDWGRGFRLEDRPGDSRNHRPLGLLSMRKRAELLGGRCEVVTEPGSGTLVRIELPLPDRSQRDGTDICTDS